MANIGGNLGAMMGSRSEAKGYSKAKARLEELKKEAEKTQKMMDPWSEYRSDYAGQLDRILQGEEDWQTDPGYQFRQQESQRAIERSGMAQGYGMSGNMAAALQQRSQDIASAEYNNIINRLTGLAAATPENAIAGGQMYGNMMQTAITGQAQAEVGGGFAKGRYHAYGGEAVHNVASLVGSFFGMDFNQGSGPAKQQGGAGGGNASGEGSFGQWMQGGGMSSGGYTNTNLTPFFGG